MYVSGQLWDPNGPAGVSPTTMQILSGDNVFVPGIDEYFLTNNPFTAAFMNGGAAQPRVSARVVSAAFRVRYIGTQLNQSGLIYLYRSQTHGTVQHPDDGQANPATWSAKAHCKIEPCDRKWHVLADHPIDLPECELRDARDEKSDEGTTGQYYPFSKGNGTINYQPSGISYARTVGGVVAGVPTFGAFVTGVPGQQFEIEYIQHTEYAGLSNDPLLMKTHADIQGAQSVMAAANHVALERQSLQPKSMWGLMQGELSKTLKVAEDTIVPKLFETAETIAATV